MVLNLFILYEKKLLYKLFVIILSHLFFPERSEEDCTSKLNTIWLQQ